MSSNKININNVIKNIQAVKPENRFAARAYAEVIKKLQTSGMKNPSEATFRKWAVDNLTKSMTDKIITLYNNKPQQQSSIKDKLLNISGIGPKLADDLIKKGVKTVADLKKKKYYDTLPLESQLFITHKPLRRIKRDLITNTDFSMLKEYVLAGSYRRGRPFSRDIDIIIRYNVADALKKLETKYKVYAYSIGEDKAATIVDFGNFTAKLDIYKTTKEEYPFMLLYLTGSKLLNIAMRSKAKKMGFTLNQHGLFKGKTKIPLKTEREIFEKLDIQYRAPHEREKL